MLVLRVLRRPTTSSNLHPTATPTTVVRPLAGHPAAAIPTRPPRPAAAIPTRPPRPAAAIPTWPPRPAAANPTTPTRPAYFTNLDTTPRCPRGEAGRRRRGEAGQWQG